MFGYIKVIMKSSFNNQQKEKFLYDIMDEGENIHWLIIRLNNILYFISGRIIFSEETRRNTSELLKRYMKRNGKNPSKKDVANEKNTEKN